jgi:L-ascorbate metabolism protein UlaG (beta-lactamase superfamily)
MKTPVLQDQAFLADVRAAEGEPGLHLWWLGQSGFLLQWQHRHVLLDPYLSDSLTRKYAGTDKPHTRMCQRVVAPEQLNFVDVVTSSHAHTDHLDPESLGPLANANPGLVLVCPQAIRDLARERSRLPDERILGANIEGVAPPGVPGLKFHPIPAAHESLEKDEAGRWKCLGFVVELGPYRIYHSGDTVLWEGLVDILRPFEVDVALLPINGRAPERRVAGNLNGREAAHLAKAISARIAVPCHYEMFEFNTASPTEFLQTCEELGQPARALGQGERLSVLPRG